MPLIALTPAHTEQKHSALEMKSVSLARLAFCLIFILFVAEGVSADPVTYRQLRQDQGGGSLGLTSLPTVAGAAGQPQNASLGQVQNPRGQTSTPASGAPVAQESPAHPEFVRLPDGRIVRYGPGVLCDENCVDPVSSAAFGSTGPGWGWWVAPPIAGGILCAVLCRGESDSQAQLQPTIIIPAPTPSPTGPTQPTPSPSASVTPPPQEIPEPGTLVLLSLGLGAMLARKRKKATE